MNLEFMMEDGAKAVNPMLVLSRSSTAVLVWELEEMVNSRLESEWRPQGDAKYVNISTEIGNAE